MRKFNSSLNGYNKIEVNNFVHEVTQEYESMLNKLKHQDEEIERLKKDLEKYQNMENTLNRALVVAEDASNQIKRVARDEAKGVIEDARRNASRIVNDALLKADKIEQDAETLKEELLYLKEDLEVLLMNKLSLLIALMKIIDESFDSFFLLSISFLFSLYYNISGDVI